MARLRELYEKEIVPALMEKFNYKNIMEAPKLEKIVVNMGVGDAKENPKFLEGAVNSLSVITVRNPLLQRPKSPYPTLNFVQVCGLVQR